MILSFSYYFLQHFLILVQTLKIKETPKILFYKTPWTFLFPHNNPFFFNATHMTFLTPASHPNDNSCGETPDSNPKHREHIQPLPNTFPKSILDIGSSTCLPTWTCRWETGRSRARQWRLCRAYLDVAVYSRDKGEPEALISWGRSWATGGCQRQQRLQQYLPAVWQLFKYYGATKIELGPWRH